MADRDEFVKVMHPELPDTQKTPRMLTRKNLEEHWHTRGWVLWEPPTKSTKKKEGTS